MKHESGIVTIPAEVIILVHDKYLVWFGGRQGYQLESDDSESVANTFTAISQRPVADPVSLAARYLSSIVKIAPFASGNEGTAWVICELCLAMNAVPLQQHDQITAWSLIKRVGRDNLSEDEVTQELRSLFQLTPLK